MQSASLPVNYTTKVAITRGTLIVKIGKRPTKIGEILSLVKEFNVEVNHHYVLMYITLYNIPLSA
jgi:hypothetical protein